MKNTALTEAEYVVLNSLLRSRPIFRTGCNRKISKDFLANDLAVDSRDGNVPENIASKLITYFLHLFFSRTWLKENLQGFSAYTYLKFRPRNRPKVKWTLVFQGLVINMPPVKLERIAWGFFCRIHKKLENGYRYFLQPIASIHLNSNLGGRNEGKWKSHFNIYIYIISIAIFILVLGLYQFLSFG